MWSLLKKRVLPWFALLALHAANAAPPAGFSYEPIGSGWNEAVGATFTEDGRLFVWERGGRVWRVSGTTKAATPFLNIAAEVGAWRDNGMLGFALHPNFKSNGYVYVAYVVDRHHLVNCSEPASGTGAPICGPLYSASTDQYLSASIARVTRYTAVKPGGDPDFGAATTVDYNSRRVLIGETPMTGCPVLFEAHAAGGLAFGDDGTLFAACGDGATSVSVDTGSNGTSHWNQALTGTPQIIRQSENVGAYRAQLTTSLSGKIMRIDPLTGDGVPSNPLYNAAAPRSPASRLWVLGVRNPFRISQVEDSGDHDPARGNPGTLLIGDVGWLLRDEFHVSRTGGENFGWPYYEGMNAHSGYAGAITYNRDAPNPLFGVAGCAQQFFAFQDLIKPDSLNAVAFRNPCNAGVNIPASVPTWLHRRPEIDWNRTPTGARWSTFDALGNPINYTIGRGGVSGQPFAGNSSTGGVFYTGDDFPSTYKNTYFHADYGAGWIRNFRLNGNFKPLAVDVFDDSAGAVVNIATNPVSGGLYFVVWNGGVNRVVYSTGNLPPTATISANRAYGASPLTVVFSSAGSRDPEGQPLTYRWNFGDGTATSAAANPSHIFNAGSSAPRSFTVSLQVTDQGGLTHTTTYLVSANNTPPVVNILAPADGTRYSLLISSTLYPVRASVTDAQHSAAQVACSIRLTLHHNSHHHDDPPIPACQADLSVTPLGCGAESYYWRIGFTATDAAGLTGYDEVLLLPDCPSTTLSANAGLDRSVVDNNGNGSEILLLDGSASNDTNGTIASYIWYRGGVQVATGVTANVAFGVGVHQVRLEVLNASGAQAADTAQITVLPQGTNFPPVASFSVAPPSGPVPFTVTVDATGTTDPDGSIANYAWNWGDGTTSSGSSAIETHRYSVAGDYIVALTARDNGSSTTTTTRSVAAEQAWWNTAWSARRKLTFNTTGINTHLSNVPVLVKLDPSRIDYTLTSPNGADLRFIDADNTTQLDYEVASWNPGGVSTVWVKVPLVDANSINDWITLYYNNPAAPAAQNPALVWSNGYAAVWHFDTGLNDSTANANHAINQGTTSEAGYLGNALRFDGASTYVGAGNGASLRIINALTIEAMVKRDVDANGDTEARIVDKKATPGSSAGYGLQYRHSTNTLTTLSQGTSGGIGGATLASDWAYAASSIAGTRAQLYLDGVNVTTSKTVSALIGSTQALHIGRMSGGGSHWDGVLDEIRISNVARTPEWFVAQQRSLSDTFIMQPVATNTPPTVAITAPPYGATLATPSSLLITAAAADAGGSVARVSFHANGALLGTDTSAPFSMGWDNPPAGVHTLTAVATDNGNLSTRSNPLNVTLTAISAELSGTTTPGPVLVNLTTTGSADWINWGLVNAASVNRKAAVTAQISALTPLGAAPARFGNDSQWNNFSWTGGTPTANKTNVSSGLYFAGIGNGYRLTLPAGTNPRTLKLYLGGWASTGEVRATLSDGSAAPYVVTVAGADVYSRVVTLVFKAASNGQTLTLTHTHKSGKGGNIGVQAATLN